MSDSLNPATALGTTAGTVDPTQKPHLVSGYSDGGHEIDNLPATQLIGLVLGMALLIVLTGVGVFQYYNLRTAEYAAETGAAASARIAATKAARAAVAQSWGETDAEKGLWRMPASEGAKRVIANPALLRASAAPAGFVHPDDVKKEGAEAAPAPVEPAVEAVPVEPAVEAVPTEAVPAEVAPESPDDAAPAPESPDEAPAEGDAP
ncbi:MAG: hypothetical protein R3F39_06645 [Myxococcota bacterium]